MASRIHRVAPALLLGVVVLALIEWVAGARAYRTTIAPEHWRALGEAVDALPPDEPVRFADDWLMPSARLNMPALARASELAPPDLREPGRIHVLGEGGHAWSDALQADLEDRPPPTLLTSRVWGGLTLSTYAWAHAAPRRASFVDDLLALRVSSEGKRCEGKRTFKCPQGRVRSRITEVDYRPRRCVEVDVADATAVQIRYPEMPLGTVLRGHVGFGDFNRRLRSDAPVNVEVAVDGSTVARFIATDADGWRALAIATTPGTAEVTVTITPSVQGTWNRTGYAPRTAHALCFELRALQKEETP